MVKRPHQKSIVDQITGQSDSPNNKQRAMASEAANQKALSELLDGIKTLKSQADEFIREENINNATRVVIMQLSSLIQTSALLLEQRRESINESLEEDKRQHSVVISGLEESSAATPMGRADDDLKQVKEILNVCSVEQMPVAVYRMGPFNEHKRSKLIKVQFPTRWAARHIIHTKKNLQSTDRFKRVHIRPSLTQEEREARAKLVQECNAKRRDTGEDWIIYAEKVILRSKVNEERQK